MRYAFSIVLLLIGGVSNVLYNKSVMMNGFISWSVSVMNSSLNDRRNPNV